MEVKQYKPICSVLVSIDWLHIIIHDHLLHAADHGSTFISISLATHITLHRIRPVCGWASNRSCVMFFFVFFMGDLGVDT